MNIDEIMNEAKSVLQENVNLRNVKDSKECELFSKIKKNYKEIFEPIHNELMDLDRQLEQRSGNRIKSEDARFVIESSFHYYIWFKVDCDCNRREFDFCDIENFFYDSWRFCRDRIFKALSVFTSTEKTLVFVDEIREVMAERYKKQIEYLRPQNENLANSIEKLTKELEQSSIVEEKQDGTVKIKIGDKVFIGTVKEKES